MEAMSRNGSKGSEWCGRKRRREEETRRGEERAEQGGSTYQKRTT